MINSDIVAVAEHRESFSESDQPAYEETSAVTTDFNHPSKDYVNYISTDLSAQMMNTHNDGQNSGRQSGGFRSWIKFQILFLGNCSQLDIYGYMYMDIYIHIYIHIYIYVYINIYVIYM